MGSCVGGKGYQNKILFVTPQPHPAVFVSNLKPFKIDVTVKEKGKNSLFLLMPSTNTCELIIDLHTGERDLLHKAETEPWYEEKCFASALRSVMCGNSSGFHLALEQCVRDAEDGVTRMIMYDFPSYVRKIYENSEEEMQIEQLRLMFFNYVARQVSRLLKFMRDDITIIGMCPKLDNAKKCFVCTTCQKMTYIERVQIGLRSLRLCKNEKDEERKVHEHENEVHKVHKDDESDEQEILCVHEILIFTGEAREALDATLDITSKLEPVYLCTRCGSYKPLFKILIN